MNETIFQNGEEMGAVIASEICDLIKTQKAPLICLAAGHSSLSVFAALAERKKQGFDFSDYFFVAMDEWTGMNADDEESCGGFLKKNFFTPLDFPAEHIKLFDGRAADLKAECEAVEQFIDTRGGVCFMLLGIGMNGHLALNEPGCDINGGAHLTELSEITKKTGQKYFSHTQTLLGGLTLGLKNIRAAGNIVVNVTGAHKAPVVKRLRESSAGADFPASLLKDLPQARFYFDAEAAGGD
ncbi:MAG: 6-phosphogluconolactonase [Treponema sp.]|jgi:galactosamine-6-phosphate isomerase|nr:6-phosphogluconolactonase [Treponema sp.]